MSQSTPTFCLRLTCPRVSIRRAAEHRRCLPAARYVVSGFSRTVAALVAVLVILCSAPVRAQVGDTVPVELSTIGIDGRTGTPIVALRDP